MWAMGGCSPLTLPRPGGEAGDDATLEDQDEDDDRDGHENGGCGDVAGRGGGMGVTLEESEHRRERQDALREALPRARPVDLRRLLELPRDLSEERDEDVDRKR